MATRIGSTVGPACRWDPETGQHNRNAADGEQGMTMDEKEDCDPDKLLQCPFDKNHQIRACRFPYHLIKCRKNHPKLAQALKTCPFNARHLIPKHEMTSHTATCVDRKSVGSDEPNADEQRKWQVPVSTWRTPRADTDEDWDKEADDSAVPFIWGASSTFMLQPEVTVAYDHNQLSAGLRAPKTLPWPVNWS
ncbi:unnamed protein product [Merluccius merluccius]